MEMGCSLLITFFLLTLQSSRSFTYMCGDYNLNERPSSTDIERCSKVEKTFEDALLNNKSNLYLLRAMFLPSSNPLPHMLNVNYSFKDTSFVTVLWSSSRVFTVIDPTILHDLQSGIMTLIYYWDEILFPQTIYLYLNFSENHFHREENDYGILTITGKLKPYAINQGKLSNWDGHDKGYVFLPRSDESQSLRWKVAVLTGISTLTIIIIGIVYLRKLIKPLSTLEEGYDTDIKRSLFWSFTNVLLITNIVDIIISLIIFKWYSKESNTLHIGLKMTLAGIVAVTGLAFGLFANKKYIPRYPQPSELESPEFTCCLSLRIVKRLDYTCATCNIFLFVCLTGFSIIPTTALMVVYPILVLSTVAFLTTLLLSIVSLFAVTGLTIIYRLATQQLQDCSDTRQKNHSRLCNGCLQIIVVIAMSPIFLLFLIIMSKDAGTYTTSGFLQGISSFFPSVIFTVVSYLAKNTLNANRKAKYEKIRKRSFSSSDNR